MPPSTNGATAPEHQAASASAFRAFTASDAYLRLPESGLVVEVARLHISDLAAAGRIPNELAGVAMRILGDERAPAAPTELQEAVLETRRVVDAVCIAALRTPRMAADAQPEAKGAIRPDDMPWADREYIFEYVCRLGSAAPLATFPHGSPGRLAPVADVAGMGDEA